MRLILVLLAVGGLMALLAPVAGPRLIRWILLRNVSVGGLRVRTIEIRHLGFREAEVARVSLRGEGPLDALTVDRIRFHYRPDRLLRGKIDGVHASGMVLNLVGDANGVRLAGKRASAGQRPSMAGLPRVGGILLDTSRIVCRLADRSLDIPLSASIRPTSEQDHYAVQIQAGPVPFKMAVNGIVDFASGDGDLSLAAPDISLTSVLHFAAIADALPFAVRASAEMTARFKAWLPSEGEYRTTWYPADSPGPLELKGRWRRGMDGTWEVTGESAQDIALAAGGVTVRGGVSATGSALFADGKIQSQALLSLKNLNAGFKARQISITNITGDIAFSDVIEMATAGPQTVRVERVQAGALVLTSGIVIFAMQGPGAIQVEQAGVTVCGGRLTLEDFQVRENGGLAEGRLRGEGIQLAQLINLMEWVTADGTAGMSGVLPFSVRGGGIRVENGSLETAGGQSSRIRIRDGQFLTRGLPADNPGYLYASIAEEALQDFRCDWARADVRLVEGMLSIALSIRGAPNRKLSFGFDVEKQVFFRTDPEKSNANFNNGLTLTLRFNDVSVEDILAGAPAVAIMLNNSMNTHPGGSP